MLAVMLYRRRGSGSVRQDGEASALPRLRTRLFSLGLAVVLHLQFTGRVRAENHADYRYESYLEEDGRISIQTHSLFFEQHILPWLDLKGNYVRDAVSGASPTGAPPPAGSSQVPLKHMEDLRNAGFIESDIRLGRHLLTPQLSYSLEHDYESKGISLSDAIDFNQKNTTLSLGYAHDFDQVFPKFWAGVHKPKDSDDFLVGVTQLLSPKAYISADFTYGYENGYLSDPYKQVRFDGYPDPTATFPENRPSYKSRQIGYLAFVYFVEALNGSVEADYRLYHDSFGILSHTVSVAWHQKIGKHVVLNPLFRYNRQSAADFYVIRLPGDPSDPSSPFPIPAYYSADYRLSSLHTFTFGLSATVMLGERVYLDLAYQRYEMHGDDPVTSASAYPKANVLSGGIRLWW